MRGKLCTTPPPPYGASRRSFAKWENSPPHFCAYRVWQRIIYSERSRAELTMFRCVSSSKVLTNRGASFDWLLISMQRLQVVCGEKLHQAAGLLVIIYILWQKTEFRFVYQSNLG